MKETPGLRKHAAMGMASLLPGITYLIERMQAEREDLLAAIARYQETEGDGEEPTTAIKLQTAGAKGAWAGMTPEERSAEMKRRIVVRRANAAKASRKAGAASRWSKMTKKQREEWKRKMVAGRKKAWRQQKALPTVQLANGRAVA